MDTYLPSFSHSYIYDQCRRRMHASFFTQLAYGAKGIHWWNIYPGLYSSHYSTTRTPYWDYAKDANDIAHFWADHLLNVTSTNAFATWFDDIPGNSFVTSVSEDSIVVGIFEHESTGQIYFMLVNPRWYAGGEKTFTIELDCDGFGIDHCVEDILATSAPWNSDPDHDAEYNLEINGNGKYEMTETLDAGEGRLYRMLDVAPDTPQNFNGVWYNNHPKIYWTANTEPDLQHYEAWKYDNSSWSLKTTTTNTYYIDNNETKYSGSPYLKSYVSYKVCAVDNANQKSDYTSSKQFCVGDLQSMEKKTGSDSLLVSESINLPQEFTLFPPAPNPFNSTTTLKLELPKQTRFSLTIYDIGGKEIWHLNNSRFNSYSAGYHTIQWDGRTNSGSAVPTGVYFIVFNSPENKLAQKIMLMK